MAVDDRAVIHFVIPVEPGTPGIPSTPMKNVEMLPPVLQKAIAGTGLKHRFACSPTLASSLRHHGTGCAGNVNCLKCRATKAWIDAPESGAFPKYPDKEPAGEDLTEFLEPAA